MCCRKQVLGTKEEAEKDGVKVPLTLQEYCVTTGPKHEPNDIDFCDYDYDDECDEDVEDEMYYTDDEDSGNEDSWCPPAT